MFFSKFFAVAAAIAPVACAYSVATVDFTPHENCNSGQWPVGGGSGGAETQKLIATKDTCNNVKVKHTWDIDTYSFGVDVITPDTPYECHGVAVFNNDNCDGEPSYFVPFEGDKEHIQTPCVSDKWDNYISVKLVCDGHAKSHGSMHH